MLMIFNKIDVMIRNKSQTSNYAGSKRKADSSVEAHVRQKSKKASLNLSKPTHLNYSHMAPCTERKNENSLLSNALSSNRHSAKTLLTGTKGMKIVNYHESSVKTKIQPSTMNQNTKSAISARILKDLVNYGQNGNSKDKKCVQSFEIIPMAKPSLHNTHRVLEEFSPMPNTHSNYNIKKGTKDSNSSANRTYMVHDFSLDSKQYVKQNFQSLNSRKQSDKKHSIDITKVEATIQKQDSHRQAYDQSIQKTDNRRTSTGNKQELKDVPQSAGKSSSMKKSKEFFNDQTEQKEGLTVPEQKLREEKEQLIFVLERVNTFIEQNYSVKYKEIIKDWDSLRQLQQQTQKAKQELSSCESSLKQLQKLCNEKKTELYLHNRDYIMVKKKKDYISSTAKQHYLSQAERIHEELRAKLTSKADYEHVIMFNMKVVLSASNHSSLYSVYQEMFRNSLWRKFVLIAKKEMGNLSGYDNKLMQDFFRKIQELENSYGKIDKDSGKMASSCLSLSGPEGIGKEFFLVMEQLVEEIQDLSLEIQTLNRKVKGLTKDLADCTQLIQAHETAVEKHIKKVSHQISEEYRQSEGKTYDFQGMLYKRYKEDFQAYLEEVVNRDKIMKRLNEIQRTRAKKSSVKEMEWSRISESSCD